MHVGHNCILLFLLSVEASEKCGAAKKLHQIHTSGHNRPVDQCVGQISPKAPACVKQSPWKWAQTPQLPQGCPFSGKASDHSVLHVLSLFLTCHK